MALTRKTPMKRTGFSRKEPKPFALATAKTQMKRTDIRKKARKPKAGDDKAMREACRGEPCYLRIKCVCIGDISTSVPAHRNEGKGMGLKVPDVLTIPACSACHYEYDQGKRFLREEKREMWSEAFARWEPVRARKMGIETNQLEIA